MEKNRLCFQLNGKPQANVSPIRQQTNTTNNPHQQTQHHNPQVASSNSSKQPQQHQAIPIAGAQQQQQQQQQQRQRSNTVSKIPTLIANHNNTQQLAAISPQHHHHQQRSSSCANTISNNCNSYSHSHSHDASLANEPYSHSNSSNSNNHHHHHHHLQPHIPIYHQQMAINPAVIAAQNALLTATASGNAGSSLLQQHGKMNLCGYDSFLHATICGGGLSQSPPPPPPPPPPAATAAVAQTSTNHASLNTQITVTSSNTNQQQQQQIATVQPIMAQNTSKHLSLAVMPQQQLKSAKILRQTSNSIAGQLQHQHHSHTNTTQNSPQYHGYQRLPSSSKHNLSALHLLSPNTEKPSLSELDKWRRDQVKSYDQLLYAKLSEKLQQTNLVSSSVASNARDCNQRRKQRVSRQRRANALQQEQSLPLPTVLSNGICLREPADYSNRLLPMVGDPVECENLLGQTSDEDINSPQDVNTDVVESSRQVAEATLVDIDKITDELTAQKANLTLNVDSLLSVDETEDGHNLHSLHEDDLDNDEDLEEDEELDEELEDLGQIVESGRNSNNSNNSSNANSTNSNTAATNNGANNSTTSSLIHRYVHEHIHHHYHHFEEKEE